MKSVKLLTGYETDTIKVLDHVGCDKHGHSVYNILCKKCNNIFPVVGANVKSGNTKQCRECVNKEIGHNQVKDLTIHKFGRLTPLEYKDGKWKCKCDCENVINVPSTSLLSGNTKSCGCLNQDIVQKRADEKKNKIIGSTINHLYIESYAYSIDNRAYYNCICLSCGEKCVKMGKYIRSGEVKSCSISCSSIIDYAKKRCGEMTVIGISKKRGPKGQVLHDCHCDCGKDFTTYGSSIRNGVVKSCGHRQKQVASLMGQIDSRLLTLKVNVMNSSMKAENRRREQLC